jgi:glycosyltransferase involved in cell wall biosynthesis
MNDEKRPSLGVVVIAKNEETDISAFLNHLLPWVDEMVIVDDGSTDGTLDIIRPHGSRITLIEQRMDPEGGFAAQRNLGIDAATADWLLHMDVDERVTAELAEEISAKIQDTGKDAYRFWRLNFYLHRAMKHGGLQRWNDVHLAKRETLRFSGKVHERAELTCGDDRVGQLGSRMWHLADESFSERLSKHVQYTGIESELILAKNIKVRWYHLIYKPIRYTVSTYIKHQGFREGTLGLIYAIHQFNAAFNWYALAWDAQNRIPRQTLEDEVSEGWRAFNVQSGSQRDD